MRTRPCRVLNPARQTGSACRCEASDPSRGAPRQGGRAGPGRRPAYVHRQLRPCTIEGTRMSASPQEWFRCVELRRRQASAPYAANLNLNVKVLDFIQFGGPYWYITLPYRLTFEGRTGAPSARPPGTSLRHGWCTRTAPPRVPLNVSCRELPSAVGLPLPLLYSHRRKVPVATGWSRHTKVPRLSRWARPKTKAFVTPECAMNGTKIIGPSRIPAMAERV